MQRRHTPIFDARAKELDPAQYHPIGSAVASAGGPEALDQINALISDKYWTVLNVSHYFDCEAVTTDSKLCVNVNAFKHGLQTYGPCDRNNLPDFRDGVGATKGRIFHGHARDSKGTEYIVEWTILDPESKIMAIVGFGKHENYRFIQNPLTAEDSTSIISREENQAILERVRRLRAEAKEKSLRMGR